MKQDKTNLKRISSGVSHKPYLKFLVDNRMRKSMTHIYCPVIVNEAVNFDEFSQPFTIFGEYDGKINEMDLFETEENLKKITNERSYHDDLFELIKEYIKHTQETQQMDNGLSSFEIEVYKKPLKDAKDKYMY